MTVFVTKQFNTNTQPLRYRGDILLYVKNVSGFYNGISGIGGGYWGDNFALKMDKNILTGK